MKKRYNKCEQSSTYCFLTTSTDSFFPPRSCTVCEGPRIPRMPRRLTKNERVHAIELWYRHRDVTMVLQHWELPHRPDRRTIQNLVRRFQSTGSTADRLRPGRPRTIQTPANRERVERDVENHPTQSIRQRSTDLQLTYDSLQRRQFSQWLLAKDQVDPLFVDRIWFTDESRYYYSRTNPHYHVEIPNSRRGLNIWCAISSLGIIGPIFYEGTMTQEKYREMLRVSFFPARRDVDPENTSWLMQDGAPAHTAKTTVEFLNRRLPGRWIGMNGTHPWPSRSPDLTPCDFWLWNELSELVYRDDPRTMPQLEQLIREAVATLSLDTIRNACRSVVQRCRRCIERKGNSVEI
ncbi:hypothetical protein BLNAU_21557 [Blattamonas nauphoetae]|uniref:Transposase n=1 Tax=Blattamonas nauphoetae TaxID=2049346 RepID=A0ABQ9WVJ2_9EUKA|nr:hypothetical protein BLNAU_21557 [Blattamonas nauphoetae]